MPTLPLLQRSIIIEPGMYPDLSVPIDPSTINTGITQQDEEAVHPNHHTNYTIILIVSEENFERKILKRNVSRYLRPRN